MLEADPVERFLESGADVGGPVKHPSPESTDNPASGTARPAVNLPWDEDNVGHNGRSRTDEPGRGNGNGGQGGPTATDGPDGNNGVHQGPSGSDPPGRRDGGHKGPSPSGPPKPP